MSDYLTIADLKKLYLVTFEARIKWRNILLMLEVSAATLETIGNKWSNNPDDCYREGLLEWLKGGEGSWRNIVKALSSPTVGHSDIARTIERDHLQSSNPTYVKLEGTYKYQLLSYCILECIHCAVMRLIYLIYICYIIPYPRDNKPILNKCPS